MKKPVSVRVAKQRLRFAFNQSCLAYGEALWTQGYRGGRSACGAESPAEDARLVNKENAQFKIAGEKDLAFTEALSELIRSVRAERKA